MRMPLLLLALASSSLAVTPPAEIKVPDGFKVELLREAGPREGSWISMAIDDAGRLYISSQDKTPESGFTKDSKWGGMWRATLGKSAQSSVPGAQSPNADGGGKLSTEHRALSTSAITQWDRVNVPVGDAMGMLWAFDSLYVSGNGPEGRGIYRCKDTDGDGNLDSAALFKAIPEGSGEHGAHAIILGPDKKLYIVNGNTTPILDGLSPDSPYRNWGEDDLLPRVNDPIATFFDKIKAPYGCVYRTDENGTKWELFAGGFRNPYDIAFNTDGELFTHDSDMEWDRGLPWYRPTRLLHVVPGGEYGFREGSAKWPPWYPDSLPPVCEIGVGCPTGMKFGTGARGWPEKYQRALFFIDWTYGRILAARLHEKGASYTARNDIKSYTYPKEAEANHDVEVFLSGKGMPITDMEFGKDGALYFTTGGRGTSAALYRVSWERGEAKAEAKGSKSESGIPKSGGESSQREQIGSLPRNVQQWDEAMFLKSVERHRQAEGNREVFDGPKIWRVIRRDLENRDIRLDTRGTIDCLGHHEPWIRFADRTRWEHDLLDKPALAKAPLDWVKRDTPDDFGPRTSLTGFLIMARSPDATVQVPLLEALTAFPLASLDDELKLLKLRILELSCARQGRPSPEIISRGIEKLLAQYPAKGPEAAKLNRELSQLLIWLTNPELGELNANLAVHSPIRPEKNGQKSGSGSRSDQNDPRKAVADSSSGQKNILEAGGDFRSDQNTIGEADAGFVGDQKNLRKADAGFPADQKNVQEAGAGFRSDKKNVQEAGAAFRNGPNNLSEADASSRSTQKDLREAGADSGSASPGLQKGRGIAENAKKLPSEAPVPNPQAGKDGKTVKNSQPTPVPNPGASVFPGRKGDDALAAAGREVIEKTLALMDKAESQEEQIWYALVLRWAHGWTPEQRVRYFRWFHEKAAGYTGGNSFTGFLNKIRSEALARCTPEERAALGPLASAPTVKPLVELRPRAFVQAWTMADLEPALGDVGKGRDFARGRELFGQAQCILCHKMGVTGGNVGPDLTAVASRFPRKDILTATLDPNLIVSDQYAMMTFTVRRGEKLQEVSGLLQEDTGGTFTVLTDPLAGTTQAFYHHVVVKKEKAAVSIMPPGLLNTLTKEEVLDLLAFLEAGGKADAGNFK